VIHVFCEEGARVSYRPYRWGGPPCAMPTRPALGVVCPHTPCPRGPCREASGALMRLLKRFMNARVVEKASIDEAYVLCAPLHPVGAPAASPPPPTPPLGRPCPPSPKPFWQPHHLVPLMHLPRT